MNDSDTATEGRKAPPQPLTFAGVAGFAYASFKRLLVFQVLIAILAAGVLVWIFERAWVPVFIRTVAELPDSGIIQHQAIEWPNAKPVRVLGSRFLAISVDPADRLEPSEGADLQVELRNTEVRLRSFLGYFAFPYPQGYVIALNRTQLESWWGAWHPLLVSSLATSVFVSLFVVWTLLGCVYAWPIRLIALYADRQLSWTGAWRVAAASLLPGALFLILALTAYGLQDISLIQLLIAAILHFIIGWAYVLASPFCLCPHQDAPRAGNPFKLPPKKTENPFATPPDETV